MRLDREGSRQAVIVAGSALLVFLLAAGPARADCPPAETTPVHAVAGQATEPVETGERAVVDGVVTAAFPGDDGLDGFFIQGREPAPDGLPAGLFVYAPGLTAEEAARLEPGQWVRLTGRTGTFHGRPQLQRLKELVHCGETSVESLAVTLPLTDLVDSKARLEGVHVRLDEPLTVSGHYELAQRGTLTLTAGGRAFQPTNSADEAGVVPAERRLLLDNGSYGWGADPIPYLDEDGTRRVGDRVEGLTGVLTHAFDRWRLHPGEPPAFENTNPRPAPLEAPADDRVRVAAFNVENYFLTLGERGAATARELRRQRAKLLAAAEQLDADVLALVEMENDPAATEDFARRLAERTGAPWRRVATDRGDEGTDAIKVALIHRADRVARVGPAWRDDRRVHHRPPLVAGFRAVDGGEPFAVAAIHFKAKRGCPDAGDVDRGQGCWNQRRTEQAEALAEFAADWRAAGHPPVLIAGDLNAYGGEDPARALAAAGKVDLLARELPPERRYTYVFRGESGYLDHLQAHPALAERAEWVTTHPINADEPRFLEFDDGGPDGRHFRPDAFRSSDHDPVVVDLRR